MADPIKECYNIFTEAFGDQRQWSDETRLCYGKITCHVSNCCKNYRNWGEQKQHEKLLRKIMALFRKLEKPEWLE